MSENQAKIRKKKRKRLKKGAKVFFIALASIVGLLAILLALNNWKIEAHLIGSDSITLEYGDSYNDPGAEGIARGTIFPFMKHNVAITSDIPQIKELGEYQVDYVFTFKDKTKTLSRKVVVVDTTAPTITLHTNPDYYTLPGGEYQEAGYDAYDTHDGDLTEFVTREEADGIVTYSVKDSHDNVATTTRDIIYSDPVPPEIYLNGGTDIVWLQGTHWFDSYYASDNYDGNITDRVIVSGEVDTNATGDYALHYTVKDSYDNETTIERLVHVIDSPSEGSGQYEDKTIYLTYDDGPYAYTDELLDILDKYNVKVTFFVTAAYPGYFHCIKRAAESGHTIAVHTATHDYATIYASEENYWNDFNRMNEIIHEQTGSYTNLFRFPGGSSNTISRNYSNGIMTRLAAQAADKGYHFFDWNTSSGDAGETTDTDTVYANVIRGIQSNTSAGRASMVLQHDIKAFSVNAVERIILWGLENGYTFKPITENTFGAHHGINN